jgi:hypothetical protein
MTRSKQKPGSANGRDDSFIEFCEWRTTPAGRFISKFLSATPSLQKENLYKAYAALLASDVPLDDRTTRRLLSEEFSRLSRPNAKAWTNRDHWQEVMRVDRVAKQELRASGMSASVADETLAKIQDISVDALKQRRRRSR